MSAKFTRRDFVRNTAIGASALAMGKRSVAKGFPANEKVQLGWIGIGSRQSGLQADMIKHCSEDARTVAVCDLIPERVELGKQRAAPDAPAGYTDFRKMMEKEKLDGILVVTEPCNHAVVVVPVLEAGFHCFAEKPMDTTVEKVDRITRAARAARDQGVIYQIGMQRRYSPPHIEALKQVHSGRIGDVMFMQGEWHWPWRPGTRRVARDGGFMVEQASHHTDVMTWAMSDKAPATCVSHARTQVPMPEGPNVYNEHQSATSWQWPDGQIFSYTHLTYLPRYFQNEKLWIFGDKGAVDAAHGMMYFCDENPRQPIKPLEELQERFAEDIKGDWGKGTKQELQGFVANIKSGGKQIPAANVETGRIATLMCIMGRMAMVNAAKNRFEPRAIRWEDLGSAT